MAVASAIGRPLRRRSGTVMTLPPTPSPAATRPMPMPPKVTVRRSRGCGRVRCVTERKPFLNRLSAIVTSR